jgi:hypothetical protein
MQFTKNDYSAHAVALNEGLEVAGAERIAAIEEGGFHMSLHFDSIGADYWDVGARGAICYAVISEIQPEELLAGRPQTTLRRSNVRTVNGWCVYLFPDGERFHCNAALPECYKNAVVDWLRVYIRNQAAGGGGGADPPILDDLDALPVSSEWHDDRGNSSGGHANSGPAMSR